MNRRHWAIAITVFLLIAAVTAAFVLDPDNRLRGRAMGEPFYRGKAASAWQDELQRSDRPESAAAFDALVAGKGEAIPVCAWVLHKAPEPAVRSRAADVLARMGKDAAPAGSDLVAALSDADPVVRGVVVRAIGELAPDVPGAVPALAKLFPDIDAIRAVAKFGSNAGEAVPALLATLNDGNPTVRWQAVRTLGKIREPALPALAELIRLTGADPDPLVREHAAEAMGDIGPAAAEGIPALVKALKDPVARVRRDAVRSLGQMGPAAKAAIADVRAAMDDADADVKTAALRAARLIDPASAKK
jgi:HEAT repeat protein